MLQLMLLVGNIKHRLPSSSRPLHQLPPIKVANCGIIQRIVLSKTRMLLGSREQAQGCIFPSCLQLVSFIRFIMAIGWEAHNEVLQHLITTVVFVFILNNNTLVKKISQIKQGICNNTFLGFAIHEVKVTLNNKVANVFLLTPGQGQTWNASRRCGSSIVC